MKKLLYALGILYLFSTFALAQETPPEAVWQFYKGDRGEFSAEFPNALKSSVITDRATKKELGRFYKTYFNRTFYFVVACDTTDCPQFDVVKSLKFRARFGQKSQFSEKTLDASTVESSFVDPEGFFQRIRQIKTEKNYFLVQIVSEKPDDPEGERFIQSFQPAASEDLQKAEKDEFEKPLAAVELDKLTPENTKTIENSEANAASNSAVKKNELAFVPVTILTKPPATYTDAARCYEISGEVMLRVSFLANKSIAEITPVNKLPFGLTEQAIAAVKLISFNPALRDGKPISVFKPVVYTFTVN